LETDGFPRILGKTSAFLASRKCEASSASRGRPETKREGGGGGVRTGSTDENGELWAEMPQDPEEGSGEQDDASVKGNISRHRTRRKNVNGAWTNIQTGRWEPAAIIPVNRAKRYGAPPLRRIYIPKEGGKKRPISIPALEDKILQKATVTLVNAIC